MRLTPCILERRNKMTIKFNGLEFNDIEFKEINSKNIFGKPPLDVFCQT